MAKTYREKIAAAKAAPKSLKKTKEIEVVARGSLSKANKLILSQAEKAKATKRNTGATKLSASGSSKYAGVSYSYEKGLEKAIKAALAQGRPQDVQRIKASQAVDISKTATRAKIAEMNLKKKKKK
jgi:hypothetical protein